MVVTLKMVPCIILEHTVSKSWQYKCTQQGTEYQTISEFRNRTNLNSVSKILKINILIQQISM